MGVGLSPEGNQEQYAQADRGGAEGKPGFFQPVHKFLVGEDKVAQKEAEAVKPYPVHDDHGGIQNFGSAPQGKDQQDKGPGREFPTEGVQPVFLSFSHQEKRRGIDPAKLDEPQNAGAAGNEDEVPDKKGETVKDTAGNAHADIALDPLEDEEAKGGGNQQLPGPGTQVFLPGVAFQVQPGGNAGHHKEQRHKPGIDDIWKGILILYRAEGPKPQLRLYGTIEKNHVIKDHQNHSRPADIVYVASAHGKLPLLKLERNSWVAVAI